MKTIDSIQPPARQHRPRQRFGQPPATGARFTAFTKTRRRRIAWSVVLTVLLSPVLFGLALLGKIGIGVVALYGVVVLVRRWPSRTSFALALAALIYMVVLQLAAADDIAQAMAVFVYALLAIGAISLAIEVKISNRMWFKKH